MPDTPDLAPLLTGYWVSQSLYVAAKLGIADLLADGPKSAADLAAATQTHTYSLYRLLRALASVGIFAEDDAHRFALTPAAERLRSDRPDSQRALAIMTGEEHYKAWGELSLSIHTGKSAFEALYNKPLFQFLTENPEKGAIFDAAMTGIHGPETAAMLDAYDFTGVCTLADIGGGNGSTLMAVLERKPELKGILFDLPGVAARSREQIAASPAAGRCEIVGGSFFESVPGGADAYLLRHIIHDWYNEQATQILKTVAAAMPADAKVLVVETVIVPGNGPGFGKLLDLAMLVLPGGMERTEGQYRKLFEGAGLRLNRIVPTKADVSVIEAVKA